MRRVTARRPTPGWTRREKAMRHHNHQHDEHSGSDRAQASLARDEKILSNELELTQDLPKSP